MLFTESNELIADYGAVQYFLNEIVENEGYYEAKHIVLYILDTVNGNSEFVLVEEYYKKVVGANEPKGNIKAKLKECQQDFGIITKVKSFKTHEEGYDFMYNNYNKITVDEFLNSILSKGG